MKFKRFFLFVTSGFNQVLLIKMEERFINSTKYAKTLKGLSENDMLKLYGLYKQAIIGPCNTPKPYFWDFTAKAKWESWKSLQDMAPNIAKEKYIELVKHLDPTWDESVAVDGSKTSSAFGVSVSTMRMEDEVTIADEEKTVFDWCKEGNLKKVVHKIEANKGLLHVTDDDNLTLLHWAADRGFLEMAEYLLRNNCDVNSVDNDLLTPLHYAATCEHLEIIKLLLKYNANTELKDIYGDYPIDCTDNAWIKELLQ